MPCPVAPAAELARAYADLEVRSRLGCAMLAARTSRVLVTRIVEFGVLESEGYWTVDDQPYWARIDAEDQRGRLEERTSGERPFVQYTHGDVTEVDALVQWFEGGLVLRMDRSGSMTVLVIAPGGFVTALPG
jgi:hypothetical protein